MKCILNIINLNITTREAKEDGENEITGDIEEDNIDIELSKEAGLEEILLDSLEIYLNLSTNTIYLSLFKRVLRASRKVRKNKV